MNMRSGLTGLYRATAATAMLVALAGTAGAQEAAIPADQFHPGDRIALTVEGVGGLGTSGTATPAGTIISDTALVRDGQILRFPTIGDISLVGVRRRDLEPYLTRQFGKFFRDPVVHATPLIRVAVLGQVGRPGYYSVPSDIPLTEIVMRAGGPTGEADLNKTVVKRGSETLMSSADVTTALASGSTLDDLRVAPGDEVVIGEKSHIGFQTILQVVGITVSLLGLALALRR